MAFIARAAVALIYGSMFPGGPGGIPTGGNGSMDFTDEDASGLLALLEDI